MTSFTVTARCRIGTPMLSSGADQQAFEIRATAVKSGMRFWWRVFQPLRGTRLWRAEETLFGSTQKAAYFKVSVRYRMHGSPPLKDPDGKEIENIQIWQPGEAVQWGPGLAYTLFSVFDPFRRETKLENGTLREGHPQRIKPKDSNPKKSGRPVAKPGGVFLVTFQLLRGHDGLQDVLCAFWALANLGGLGGRTRRGAGSFDVEEIWIKQGHGANHEKFLDWQRHTQDNGVPSFTFQDGDEPQDFVHRGIQILLERWGEEESVEPGNGIPRYTAISKHARFWVTYNDEARNQRASSVHEAFMARFKNYCYRHPFHEAKTMHQAIATGASVPEGFIVTKATKGLPIIYNFSKKFGNIKTGRLKDTYTLTTVVWNKGEDEPQKTCEGEPLEGSGRRASPLLVSCHMKKGQSYVVVSYLPATLISADEKLWLKPLDHFFDPPGFAFVEQLMDCPYIRKNEQNMDETVKPLSRFLPKCFSVYPEVKQLTGKKPSARQQAPRSMSLPSGPLDQKRVRKHLDHIADLEADGKEEESKKMAQELGERLRNENQNLWKEFENEIKAYS